MSQGISTPISLHTDTSEARADAAAKGIAATKEPKRPPSSDDVPFKRTESLVQKISAKSRWVIVSYLVQPRSLTSSALSPVAMPLELFGEDNVRVVQRRSGRISPGMALE